MIFELLLYVSINYFCKFNIDYEIFLWLLELLSSVPFVPISTLNMKSE